MKIKKINETLLDIERTKEIDNELKKLKTEKNLIEKRLDKLIRDYIEIHIEKFEKDYDYEDRECVHKISINNLKDTTEVWITYNYNEGKYGDDICLSKEDSDDILMYLNYPELYKSTKKYNL